MEYIRERVSVCESEKESVSESLSLGERVREEERKREREREKVRNAENGWEHRLCQSETKIQKKMIVVPKSHTCRWIYIHEI